MMLLEDAIVKGCQSIQIFLSDKDDRVRSYGYRSMTKILVTFWNVNLFEVSKRPTYQ